MVRSWSFNSLQIGDFVITPDCKTVIAISVTLNRVSADSRLNPAMSARPVDSLAEGTVHASPFAYQSMERGLISLRLADKAITSWVCDGRPQSNGRMSGDLQCEITSIKLSQDGKKVLVSCSPDEMQLWSIEPQFRLIRKFTGHSQTRFLIRSSFGAPKDRFILSGSEGVLGQESGLR